MKASSSRCSRVLVSTLATLAGFATTASCFAGTSLIDFSRNDGVQGNDTASPDANGNYWNNMGFSNGAGTVPQGFGINNMVTLDNSPTTIGLTVISTTFANNGINNGGLLSPDPLLLGDFAIATATQDYFFVQGTGATGTLRLSGLNTGLTYDLSMFATRNTSSVRTTEYSVTDINGSHTVQLQTSGDGAGTAAYPQGNNDTIVSLSGLVPNGLGQIDLTVTEINGGFAYLGILEITSVPEPTTVALAGLGGLALLFARRRNA